MELKKDIGFTYKGFLHNAWRSKNISDKQEISELAQLLKNISSLNSPAIPAFFIIDYIKNDYLLLSEGMGGYDARDFMENGLQKTLDIYSKDDFKIYNEKIFQNNISILQ